MISKWSNLKEDAIRLRKKGLSIRKIEESTGIPRSTLSHWLRSIKLSKEHEENLKISWNNALIKARKNAVTWHNQQKKIRVRNAEIWAETTLFKINTKDENILSLALAMLYLGEGFKSTAGTGIGNTDPSILKFFISVLKKYGIPENKIRCELHLRADQNPEVLKKTWSRILNIPLKQFRSISFDKRTIGSRSYENYYGVCVVRCGTVEIQRKLMYLSKVFTQKVIDELGG